MSPGIEKWLEPGLWVTIFGSIATVLGLAGREVLKRVGSGTKRIQAEDTAQANLYDTMRAENASLILQLKGKDEIIEMMREQISRANTRLDVVAMLASPNPNMVVEMAQDSAFVDLNRPLRPRPQAKAAPPAHDPFARLESEELHRDGRRKTDPRSITGPLRIKKAPDKDPSKGNA